MTTHATLHAQYPASQDGFATTIEMGQWLIEHRLVGAEPNGPFLLILRRIDQQTATCRLTHGTNEDCLDTRVYLGTVGEEPQFARVAGSALVIGAGRFIPFAKSIVTIERGFQVQLGDFFRTPIKEAFTPPFTSRFAPGEVTQAFIFDVGLEAIESRVLAECEHVFGLIPWYAKAAYQLGLAPATEAMRAAVDKEKQLVLKQVRSALLGGRFDPNIYLAQARALGLGQEDGVIEIEEGVFFSPIPPARRAPRAVA